MYLNKKVLIYVTCALLAACAGNNPEISNSGSVRSAPVAPETSASGKNLASEDQKICKLRQITGSRFKQKTCMTAEEWENMSYETKKMLNKNTRNKIRHDP